MNRPLRRLAFPLLVAALASCSGKPIIPEIQDADPKAIPADLQKKFEVVEESEPSPEPSPTPEPKSKSKSKKKTKPKKAKRIVVVDPETGKKRKVPPVVIPDRRRKPNPIWVGEKQTFEVTYLGLAAGRFSMEVLPPKKIADRNVYHFRGLVKSSAMLNMFYRLDDMIESFWDYEGLFSHRFHMALDETKQKRDVLELYDQETRKAFYWNRRNQPDKPPVETKQYFDMAPFAQDSFTAIYYLRTLPLKDGATYVYPVISEGKGWDCVVTVVRREMSDTPMGRRMTIVVNPQTRYNGVMKQEKGAGFIWLTDDDRRFVVRLEAKVKIGSVAAQLKEVELGEKPTEP